MASSQTCILSLLLFFQLPLTFSTIPSQPNALVLPISKHASLQYVTTVTQRTPLAPVNVVVDLGGPFLWISSSNTSYKSSSYHSVDCRSSLCSSAQSDNKYTSQCSRYNRCILLSTNAFTSKVSIGSLSEDVLTLQATDGLSPTSIVSVPRFIFLYAPNSLAQGLAGGAKGVAGFGHSRIGLPAQLAREFNFTRKFAICLSPSTNTSGVIFFGDGPYALFPGIDVSKILTYTPLELRPENPSRNFTNEPLHSHDYYITVSSIEVNGKQVPLNSSLGRGGTKISTITPFTTLESSVYNSLTRVFINDAMAANATRVTGVAPFKICFSTKVNNGDVIRPGFPVIDFILQDEQVFWRIFETNAMVPVADGVACLGFLDGGLNAGSSIVIGGYQLEDNLLQFDLVSSRLGFTSSLLLRETSCDSFNFRS